MDIAAIIKNDPEFVAGFDAAIEEVNYILWHTENPKEALKEWVRTQTEIVQSLTDERVNGKGR